MNYLQAFVSHHSLEIVIGGLVFAGLASIAIGLFIFFEIDDRKEQPWNG